jgi:chromosome segregation protein
LLILKRVELQGFKSFCERTELRFAGSGVSAVVGPNGCGKSNLGDAISWVLGEQSAKSLRGSRMEDVIFAGTRDRKPLGMAQVTMVLVDPAGRTAIPGARPEKPVAGNGHSNGHTNGHGAQAGGGHEQEVTITRRLFRSGESEYLINGKIARLRDIQELFMGTGLGPESYAIIEQGRIGQILSSKPLDRRAIVEEAAGISKFRTKRRLAEAKLESARQNLARVFDILEEVGRQANSLKRQAGKARRYEELKGELDAALRVALAGRHYLLAQEAERIAAQLSAAAERYQRIAASVEAGEKALAESRTAAYKTEADLAEARKRHGEARIEAERTRGQIESQAGQARAIDQRLQDGEAEIEQLDQRLAQLERERENLEATLAELRAQAAEAAQRLGARTAERDAAQTRLSDSERGLETARQQAVRLLGEAAALKNQVGQIETYLSSLGRDSARVARDEESARLEIERLEAAKKELGERLAARQMELESVTGRRAEVESGLQAGRAAAQQTRRELDQSRAEASRLKARRDSLEEILSHRAYTTESVKRLFTAAGQGQVENFRPAGVLADFVDLTDSRFERATEEFLHDELEYVVVRSWEEAQRGVELLRGDLDGRATFLVEPGLVPGGKEVYAASVPEPAIGPETGIAGRLSEGLRFSNGLTGAPPALIPRLARCFLAESRESAQRLSTQYPELYFLLEDGVCYHGHAVSGGRKTGAGPLALKRELRELNALVQQRQAAVASAEERLERLEREVQSLGEDLDALRAEQQRQEKETLVLDQEMRKAAEEHNRAAQKLSVSRLELERLARDAARSQQERAARLALLEEKEQARTGLEESLNGQRERIEALRAMLSRLAEEHSVARVEQAGIEERARGCAAALGRLTQQDGELRTRRQNLASEMERIGAARTRLLEDNLELEDRAVRLAGELRDSETAVAELAGLESAQRAGLSAAEEELKRLRAAAAEAQDQRSQIELDLVRKESELKFLDETSRKDLNLALSELAATPAAGPAMDPPDEMSVAGAEERVGELRRRIEALGPVNPEALSEYQEAQQRYDFLNAQRQDLLDSIRDTEKAIHDIDVESRRRFNEAFGVINENFKEMFRTLFGGGTGEMRLIGEGDALDQGIEIVAQPPGKRLQNVQLLSGGEKALTAIALLMGIFRYQPSPFCVLDEVDAPLDEANVGRFIQLVKEMAAHTQFIVITHAKKTMESAETLYGVTMQEQGVSKLVSVKLQAPPPPPPVSVEMAARV